MALRCLHRFIDMVALKGDERATQAFSLLRSAPVVPVMEADLPRWSSLGHLLTWVWLWLPLAPHLIFPVDPPLVSTMQQLHRSNKQVMHVLMLHSGQQLSFRLHYYRRRDRWMTMHPFDRKASEFIRWVENLNHVKTCLILLLHCTRPAAPPLVRCYKLSCLLRRVVGCITKVYGQIVRLKLFDLGLHGLCLFDYDLFISLTVS